MTGAELREARHKLGLSTYQLANALRLGQTVKKGGDHVRELERGARAVSDEIARQVEGMLRELV